MDLFGLDLFTDSDSEPDMTEWVLTKEYEQRENDFTSTEPQPEENSGTDKLISNLEENMQNKCHVVTVKENSDFNPYMPRLEVADCIKPIIGNALLPSDLPDLRMAMGPVPQDVRCKKRTAFKIIETDYHSSVGKYNSGLMNRFSGCMTFALHASLHEMAVPDRNIKCYPKAKSSYPEPPDVRVAAVNYKIDTSSSVFTISKKELLCDFFKSEEKPNIYRYQAVDASAGPSQVQSVPRHMHKSLNQPEQKRKIYRNRLMQPQYLPQPHQTHLASEPELCDNAGAAPQNKRALKNQQKKIQKQQRKHRG